MTAHSSKAQMSTRICGYPRVSGPRIIRCKDDLQWIVQAWQSPKWRNLSYHTEWNSIAMRWSALNVPEAQPTVTTSTLPQEERDILSAIMGSVRPPEARPQGRIRLW